MVANPTVSSFTSGDAAPRNDEAEADDDRRHDEPEQRHRGSAAFTSPRPFPDRRVLRTQALLGADADPRGRPTEQRDAEVAAHAKPVGAVERERCSGTCGRWSGRRWHRRSTRRARPGRVSDRSRSADRSASAAAALSSEFCRSVQRTAVLVERRPQPHDLAAQRITARGDLDLRSAALGVPSTLRASPRGAVDAPKSTRMIGHGRAAARAGCRGSAHTFGRMPKRKRADGELAHDEVVDRERERRRDTTTSRRNFARDAERQANE